MARFLVGTGFYDEDKGKHRHLIAAAEPLQQLEGNERAVLRRPKNPLPFIAAGAEMINCALKLDPQWAAPSISATRYSNKMSKL